MGRMTVGEVADAVGVSAKAIRLWEAKGLLPDIERTPGGYRLYDESHLAILRFIHQAKTLGMTLADIKRVLGLQHAGTVPCEQVTQMLDDRIAEIEGTLSDLTQLHQTLLTARQRADDACDIESGALICRIIERRF
jgi:MerR family copper efflux transcriptional regulator